VIAWSFGRNKNRPKLNWHTCMRPSRGVTGTGPQAFRQVKVYARGPESTVHSTRIRPQMSTARPALKHVQRLLTASLRTSTTGSGDDWESSDSSEGQERREARHEMVRSRLDDQHQRRDGMPEREGAGAKGRKWVQLTVRRESQITLQRQREDQAIAGDVDESKQSLVYSMAFKDGTWCCSHISQRLALAE
jgi:hypothetical protein